MSKGIIIADREYNFQEASHLLARAISSVVDKEEERNFSIANILCLLRNMNEYVPGEFEIRRTYSHHYQIVYKFEDEVIEGFKEKWEGFIE